jgi:hypothetical protein
MDTMLKKTLIHLVTAAVLGTAGAAAFAQAPQAAPGQPRTATPADLLTQQERDAFRQKYQAAQTDAERQKLRAEQRALLEQRAKEKGVTLAAPAGRGGPGHGAGPHGGGAYSQLFTQEERDKFRQQMQSATTPEERQKLQEQQRALAETRAKEKGITLPPPGMHAGRGGHGDARRETYNQLFTQQERDAFRTQMHAAQTPEERQKLRAEHRALAESRAKDKGITLPPEGHRGPHGPGGPGPATAPVPNT